MGRVERDGSEEEKRRGEGKGRWDMGGERKEGDFQKFEILTPVCFAVPICTTVPNFVQVGQAIPEILTAHTFGGSKYGTLPYFVQIGQTIAEIQPFFDFQDGGRPPSCIFKSSKF